MQRELKNEIRFATCPGNNLQTNLIELIIGIKLSKIYLKKKKTKKRKRKEQCTGIDLYTRRKKKKKKVPPHWVGLNNVERGTKSHHVTSRHVAAS